MLFAEFEARGIKAAETDEAVAQPSPITTDAILELTAAATPIEAEGMSFI